MDNILFLLLELFDILKYFSINILFLLFSLLCGKVEKEMLLKISIAFESCFFKQWSTNSQVTMRLISKLFDSFPL